MKQTLLLLLFCVGSLRAQIITTPPPTSVRSMAEWEELQTLLISWKSGYEPILTEIVRAGRKECKVVICCNNQSMINTAKSALYTAGVDTTSNVKFVSLATTSVWIRDYGPNTIYANDVDSIALVDWIYNRNRPNDNTLPQRYGQNAGFPVYSTTIAPYDLVNTGGNFMSDGMGTAFASKLILRNNDQVQNGEGGNLNDIFGTTAHTESSIDQVMAEFMGIDRYIKMDELPYDGIHHIDMHMKLLDEETLLVGEYPANVSDGPQLEANLLYVLNNFKTSFGKDFKVVRIPMPSFNNTYPPYSGSAGLYPTYANAVFVNKTVIMPKYNMADDIAARDTFQKYLPGYEIVQIDCNSMIDQGGAIHCITKEVGVNDPMRIVHSAIRYADNSYPETYRVNAMIQHRSGITGASLFWTTDLNGTWNEIALTQDSGTNNWSAYIPQQTMGTTVYYYIQATAVNGKTGVRPLPAPAGYWSFNVLQTSSVNQETIADWKPVFPNPARSISAIPVHFSGKTRGSIFVTNTMGQVMETIFEGDFPVGDAHYFIHADRYPAGSYEIVLQTPHQQLTQTLIVD